MTSPADFERRQEDKRIDEILKRVNETHDILQGENGICVRTAVNERSISATQKELTDHKSNHWQFAGIVLAGTGIVVTIVIYIAEKIVK